MRVLKADIYLAFDMDGTLYDASDFAAEAFQIGVLKAGKVLNKSSIKPPDKEAVMKLVGCTTDEIYSSLFGTLSSEEQRVISDSCTESFAALISQGRGKLIAGVYETLEALYEEGFLLLTASNGRPEYVMAVLSRYNLKRLFAEPLLFCRGKLTDKGRILAAYKERMKDGDLLIMIGDRLTDRIAAKENGVPFIGCAFGHAGDREIRGERWIVNSFGEIPAAVKKICGEL